MLNSLKETCPSIYEYFMNESKIKAKWGFRLGRENIAQLFQKMLLNYNLILGE